MILELRNQNDSDLQEFLDFALGFLDDKGKQFFDLTEEDMKRCKQLVFPAQIYVDSEKMFTPMKSVQFSGVGQTKKTPLCLQSLMWCSIVDVFQTAAIDAQEDYKLKHLAEQFQLSGTLI